MAIPSQKLAAALHRAKQVSQSQGADILRSADLKRGDRELLVRHGWLHEVIRGWYLLLQPSVRQGDSTPWFSHFWEFLAVYLAHQYGDEYCLSAESSLLLHTRSTLIPKQLVVITERGGLSQDLPHGTSLFAYADPKALPDDTVEIRGLRCMGMEHALCKVGPRFFQADPEEAAVALSLIVDSGGLLDVAARYGLPRGLGRVIGALAVLGRKELAEDLREGVQQLGLTVREENPFVTLGEVSLARQRSPLAARIETLWRRHRDTVVRIFEGVPTRRSDEEACLERIDQLYVRDAYHSLSIEGYHVDSALVERVRNNGWHPDLDSEAAAERNTLAARGYFEAFQEVRKSIAQVLRGREPSAQFQRDLSTWYSSLWAPMVRVGILEPQHVRGYRRGQVYIRGSMHVPPPKEAVVDGMETLFQCLAEEENAAARAVLGHFVFAFIHPYMDGNGRIARFLMNLMFVSGGHPWTVIRTERRAPYMQALEHVETERDIEPFARFVKEELEASLDV